MGAFSGQQMQQAAHQTQTGQVFGRGDGQQTFNLAERLHGGFARTCVAPGHPQHHGVEQGGLRHPFALLGTPVACLCWQFEQGHHAAQCQVRQHKAQHQSNDHQVQGQVDPVRRHKHRDRAVLLTQTQRHRDGHTKQGNQPQSQAHLSGPPMLWPKLPWCRPSEASWSSGFGPVLVSTRLWRFDPGGWTNRKTDSCHAQPWPGRCGR